MHARIHEQTAADTHERVKQRQIVVAVLDLLVDEARKVRQQLMDARIARQTGERRALELEVVAFDSLGDFGVEELHLFREHVLDERLAVHVVHERVVLDGRAAARVVLDRLVLRDHGLHAVNRQPVDVEHGPHGDLRQWRVQQLRQVELLVVPEEQRLVVVGLAELDVPGRFKAVQALNITRKQSERASVPASALLYTLKAAEDSKPRRCAPAAPGSRARS